MALSLKAFLSLDGSGFELGIKRAQSVASKFTSDMRAGLNSRVAQFIGVTAITAAIKKTADYAAQINDLSARLGVSTDAIQQWDFVATQAGASAEKVASFFEKLAEAREDALGGNDAKIASFRAFGVSESDLRSMRLEDIGLKIGNAVKEGDAQKLISSLRNIGGRGASSLVAAFRAGLEDAFAGAPIMKAEEIVALDAVGDQLEAAGKRLMIGLAPAILFLAQSIFAIIQKVQTATSVLGAYYMARLQGVNKFEAMAGAMELDAELEAEQKRLEDAIKAQIEAAKSRGSGGSSTTKTPTDIKSAIEKTVKPDAKTPSVAANINQLQQIGARVSFNPVQNALQENTKALRLATHAFEKVKQINPNDNGGVQYA